MADIMSISSDCLRRDLSGTSRLEKLQGICQTCPAKSRKNRTTLATALYHWKNTPEPRRCQEQQGRPEIATQCPA
jgi:hypothetical protein